MTYFVAIIFAFNILYNAAIHKEFQFNFSLWLCCIIYAIFCNFPLLYALLEVMGLAIFYESLKIYKTINNE